jgi:putative transposase
MVPPAGGLKVGLLSSARQCRRAPSRRYGGGKADRATGERQRRLALWSHRWCLGHKVSDQTIGNILRRIGLGTAPERQRHTTWAQFIRSHKHVLWTTDFFTEEVWSTSGLVTVYVLFFIHLQTRKIILGGLTPPPDERWVKQIARNVTGVTGWFQETQARAKGVEKKR